MVLGFYGRFPSQSQIESTVRTNPDDGTWSFGLVRGLAQSARSGSSISPFGLAPVRRDVNSTGASSWTDTLVQLLDSGIPVIVLQHYDPADIEDGDGHYRVAVGHSNDSIFLLDPWDRDGQPHLISMNRSMFDLAWSIDESTDFALRRRRRSTLPSSRFVGVFVAPLELSVTTRVNAANYSADIYAQAAYGVAVNRFGGSHVAALHDAQMSLWLPDSSVMTLQPLTTQLSTREWLGRDAFRAKWSVVFLDRNSTFAAQNVGFRVSVSGDVKLRMIATETSGEFAYRDTIGTVWGPASL